MTTMMKHVLGLCVRVSGGVIILALALPGVSQADVVGTLELNAESAMLRAQGSYRLSRTHQRYDLQVPLLQQRMSVIIDLKTGTSRMIYHKHKKYDEVALAADAKTTPMALGAVVDLEKAGFTKTTEVRPIGGRASTLYTKTLEVKGLEKGAELRLWRPVSAALPLPYSRVEIVNLADGKVIQSVQIKTAESKAALSESAYRVPASYVRRSK
jgi:hypothetical protein